MIVVYHHNNVIVSVDSFGREVPSFSDKTAIAVYLQDVATQYPEIKIVWCHQSLKEVLCLDFIANNITYQNTLFSYNPSAQNYLTDAIAYVENSPFMNVNGSVKYPTWLMSSFVGYAHASVFLALDKQYSSTNFNYYLNSIAKAHMPLGLFCYSEPKLIKEIPSAALDIELASTAMLFKFVKQHFKTRWVFLLLFDFFIYDKKIPLLSFIQSFLFTQLKLKSYSIKDVPNVKHSGITDDDSIDVIIPTIGREKYLFDVLTDLENQTIKPKSVIIIEQNNQQNAVTALEYLYTNTWSFEIQHQLISQLGACNARNIALEKLKSKWVFFADDDVRLDSNFLEDCLLNCKNYGQNAITVSCLQPAEVELQKVPVQWESFGSGCSLVAKEALFSLQYDLRFEFGFGEDADFGKKIRDKGTDVVFFPTPNLIHLKAPIGGFRTKFPLKWQDEKIQPKPSPTVMLYKLLYCTPKELQGYKTVLFFKYYLNQNIKNPFSYIANFRKQWGVSLKWANQLKNS